MGYHVEKHGEEAVLIFEDEKHRCEMARLPMAEVNDAVGALAALDGEGKSPRAYYPGLAEECRRAFNLTIDAIKDAAREKGYCIAVHGSLSRDIDLLAVPWVEDASSAEELVEVVRAAAEQASPHKMCFPTPARPGPTVKPHGRLAWSLHLMHGPFIDLSVMPRSPHPGTGAARTDAPQSSPNPET